MFYYDEKPILIFKHSSNYTTDIRENEFQYRFLNHLNPILTEYARMVRFPEINFSEDFSYSEKLKKLNLIKKEFTFDTNQIMYHYLFSNKNTLTGKK